MLDFVVVVLVIVLSYIFPSHWFNKVIPRTSEASDKNVVG